MISAFANTWRIPELRDRILFTLAMIIIVRLGVHITLPGVDGTVIKALMDYQSKADPKDPAGGLTAVLAMFSGGGLQAAGLFALGIMPYISASIMIQLMTAVVPKLARLSREDGGRQKITQFTRYLTIVIALVQGFFVAKSLTHPESMPYLSAIATHHLGTLVPDPSLTWYALVVATVVAGAMLLMWIGDQITERGIGNGTSVIIAVNIMASLPGALIQAWHLFVVPAKGTASDGSAFNSWKMLLMLVLLLVVIAGVIALTQAQRRIAVQYAKRVVGRKQFGGQTQYLPLKVNYAGVMPIIFATAVLSLPPMMLKWIFPNASWATRLNDALAGGGTWYYVLGALFIFFFSYFWVATMFQPSQIAEDLKRNGGYIPGVRPGKPTAEFLDFTMTRLTFAGAIFLTIIFMLPVMVGAIVSLPPSSLVLHFFGGTSLLIMVGVVLDVMRQVETHLIQKHYDGFLRKGKIKGRYDRLAQTGSAASRTALVYLWTVVAVLVIFGTAVWIYNRGGH
ncbi:preprotein translocase subunit SecY [Luteolibacter ambystomatis]|uniref:Protein translocase subunit SecY n=1 Tax=Luteolibacter ambystomatis TaxID=2824561 RepID=A0A975G943_9BACT|nr:preprotein translocase subunit SecY [Luteolibacter ambystomatis]QUE51083.1 preprotein translocase subunit SecY [Luteolibacter ambystomatis]